MDISSPTFVFAPVRAALEQFAKDYDLLIERFRHGGPSWDFVFRHPVAGGAKIQVLPGHDEGYALVATWEVHDLPARQRRWKRSALMPAGADPRALLGQLELLLREVIAWDGSDWTRVMPHLPEVTDVMIANAMERDSRRPLPRLSG
jgi:hypothetical protein